MDEIVERAREHLAELVALHLPDQRLPAGGCA